MRHAEKGKCRAQRVYRGPRMRPPRTQSVLKRICRFAGGSHSRAVVCSLALAFFLIAARCERQGRRKENSPRGCFCPLLRRKARTAEKILPVLWGRRSRLGKLAGARLVFACRKPRTAGGTDGGEGSFLQRKGAVAKPHRFASAPSCNNYVVAKPQKERIEQASFA